MPVETMEEENDMQPSTPEKSETGFLQIGAAEAAKNMERHKPSRGRSESESENLPDTKKLAVALDPGTGSSTFDNSPKK